MLVELECIAPLTLQSGYYYNDKIKIKQGQLLMGEFTDSGVSFLNGDCWTLPFSINLIKDYFKVRGQ